MTELNDATINGRYEEIRKLTDIYYAVKGNGKWGVFNGNTATLVIPCEYDRVMFDGGYVLLNKDGLWGAKTILQQDGGENLCNNILSVNIPTRYKEIKVLDSTQQLFGVKLEHLRYDDSKIDTYTIVDHNGNVYGDMSKLPYFDKQCEIFDGNLDMILASRKGELGFVSSRGFVTVPFQYDYVQRRDDGLFNVRKGDSWGVLSIHGKEVVSVKYSCEIPLNFADEIVQNAATGRYGILSKDGSEKVPSIYEHLMTDDDFIYFGYNGDEYGGNFFSKIDHAKWGVMEKNGNVLIPPCYDCYVLRDGYILAGRDGSMLHKEWSSFGSAYSGVYDLYTYSGELIFGGFSKFDYDAKNGVYIFLLGGEWEYYTEYEDYIERDITYYKFEPGIGLWLYLDKDLKSIIRRPNGSRVQFRKGVKCNIETQRHDNRITHVINLPIDIMSKGYYKVQGNNIIIADSNNDGFRKYAAIDIITGKQSPFYEKVEFVGDSMFFFSQDGKVGMRNYEDVVWDARYMFITMPINGYCFTAREIDNNYSCLELRSIYNDSYYIAIENIETSELIEEATFGSLKIEYDDTEMGLRQIILSNRRYFFDDAFIEKISKKSHNKIDIIRRMFSNISWFASDYRMSEDYHTVEHYDSYLEDDYKRDTWDAMTDGMYGDMPDDFDGDYSFLGR